MAPTKITTDATVRMILPKNTTAAKIIAKTMNNIMRLSQLVLLKLYTLTFGSY